MKKLLGISIVAMLAVTPMMARAVGETPSQATTGSEPYLGVNITTTGDNAETKHIASTAYVKGAYNAAIGAVNDLSTKKQDNLQNSANEHAAITGYVQTSVRADGTASDTSLVTEKAVRDAIDEVDSANTTSAGAGISKDENGVIAVDTTQDGGLQMTGEGASATLGVKVNTATMNLDSNGIGIKDAGVGSAQLANGAVTGDKIAANAVTAAKLDTDAVETAKIKNLNVTTAKLDTGAVTAEKLASDAVTTDKILDSNVTTGKLADSAVTETKIADNAVTYAKLDSGLVKNSIRSSVDSGAEGYSAWYSGQTVASEKAVADAITASKSGMATESGVVATINSAVPTIQIYDTWNSTSTTDVSGTIAVPNDTYVSGN